jgi:HEPN domain-containing protein
MPTSDAIVAEVAKWVEKAEHDLSAAVRLVNARAEELTDVIAFHSQQKL